MKQYLDLCRYVLENGEKRQDRTGTGTISKFGYQMRVNLEDGFPLLTTKKVFYRGIFEELFWFLKGETNIRPLALKNVKIWNDWPYDKYKKSSEYKGETMEEKGLEFKYKVFNPLFFNPYDEGEVSPFYLYVNVTTPEMLRKVLANPKKYAPSGVYIVRIHGTFVNFLDLSPEIQEDIIKRLDPGSTEL